MLKTGAGRRFTANFHKLQPQVVAMESQLNSDERMHLLESSNNKNFFLLNCNSRLYSNHLHVPLVTGYSYNNTWLSERVSE